MSIEKIGDFITNSEHSKSLMRVFYAYKLEKLINELLGEKVKVVLKSSVYTIYCTNAAQAQYLKVNTNKIIKEIPKENKLVIKVKF